MRAISWPRYPCFVIGASGLPFTSRVSSQRVCEVGELLAAATRVGDGFGQPLGLDLP